MPNYKGHLMGGVLIYTVALIALSLYSLSFVTVAQWFLCTLAGALFPDIDIKSKGQQLYYKVILCIALVCIWYKLLHVALFLCLFSFLPLLVKHRGLFHNIWFLLTLTGAFTITLVRLMPTQKHAICINALFFLLGVISHLWLDLGPKKMLKWRV